MCCLITLGKRFSERRRRHLYYVRAQCASSHDSSADWLVISLAKSRHIGSTAVCVYISNLSSRCFRSFKSHSFKSTPRAASANYYIKERERARKKIPEVCVLALVRKWDYLESWSRRVQLAGKDDLHLRNACGGSCVRLAFSHGFWQVGNNKKHFVST